MQSGVSAELAVLLSDLIPIPIDLQWLVSWLRASGPVLVILTGLLAIGFFIARAADQRRERVKAFRKAEEDLPDYMFIMWPQAGNGSVVNERGTRLHTYSWRCGRAPRALVFLTPGYGDCAATHAHVAKLYVDQGCDVFSLDHSGHGFSDGTPGLVWRWEDLVGDAQAFFNLVKQQYPPEMPSFIYGCSMGGAIASDIVSRDPASWSGLILLSPMFGMSPGLYSAAIMKTVEIVAQVFPSMPLARPVNSIPFTHDLRVVEFFRLLPTLYHGRMRAGTGWEFIRLLARDTIFLDRICSTITTPTIILHGSEDAITSPDMSRQVAERLVSADVEYVLIPGGWHDLTHEFEWPAILDHIVRFVVARS